MSKTLKFIVTFLILCGCSYEPVLLKKNYDFHFDKINSTGEIKINEIKTVFVNRAFASVANYPLYAIVSSSPVVDREAKHTIS